MTGRLPRPQSLSLGLCVQPAAATHPSHCVKVTSYLPAANGRAKVTLRCGPSSGLRPRSLGGDPIMNSPAGTTIISGQSTQSRNPSFGAAASPARLPFSWAADTDRSNRTSRRKAIATRKVGSTMFNTEFASLLKGHQFGQMLVSTHAKFIVRARAARAAAFYLISRLPSSNDLVAAKLADMSEDVLVPCSWARRLGIYRQRSPPPFRGHASRAATPAVRTGFSTSNRGSKFHGFHSCRASTRRWRSVPLPEPCTRSRGLWVGRQVARVEQEGNGLRRERLYRPGRFLSAVPNCMDLSRIGDISSWVSVEYDQIGKFAR